MKTTLARLPVDVPATVVSVACDRALKRRLHDFGLIPGTFLHICYRNARGGVTALECRGAVIALRTKDLKGIQVRVE